MTEQWIEEARTLSERVARDGEWHVAHGNKCLVLDADGCIVLSTSSRASASEAVSALAAVPRLLAEVDRLRAEVVAADERMAAVLDGTFSVGDGTAQREIERLRAELGHVEPAEEPACEAMAGGDVRCECCYSMILAGEPVDIFEDGDRWVSVHPGPCPEPDLWYVAWTYSTEAQWTDSRHQPAPFEEAVYWARLWLEAGPKGLASVRVVRYREEVSRG